MTTSGITLLNKTSTRKFWILAWTATALALMLSLYLLKCAQVHRVLNSPTSHDFDWALELTLTETPHFHAKWTNADVNTDPVNGVICVHLWKKKICLMWPSEENGPGTIAAECSYVADPKLWHRQWESW